MNVKTVTCTASFIKKNAYFLAFAFGVKNNYYILFTNFKKDKYM